ncbi:3-phosphoshikimate 1-carboxyvinyltransferase, partial [Chloroflexota bacterium]
MRALLSKSEIKGKVVVPSSKSYTIRGLVCAALARGQSEIINPLGSDDTESAQEVLTKIGVEIFQGRDTWRVSGGSFCEPKGELFCRESAATLRFMTAIGLLVPGVCRLTASPSLSRRPIKPLIQALKQLGVDCLYQNESVVIKGGKLKGGVAELPGNISSQFVSALLLISPFADEGIKIKLTTTPESKPFILMTLECMNAFGIKVIHSPDLREYETSKQTYKPTKYKVEGDWSSASYFVALGALCGDIKVESLNTQSLQGDKEILSFLKEMGASVTVGKDSVIVRRSKLKAISVDLTDCIDLLPTMAVLAAVADKT